MKTRCAWCDKESGYVAKPGVSHTICAKHRNEMLRSYGVSDVARTYKDLRVERNDTLEHCERTQRIMDRVQRTVKRDWLAVGTGLLGGAMVLGFALLLWIAL